MSLVNANNNARGRQTWVTLFQGCRFKHYPGADPTIASYKAGAVKIYNAKE
jgi:hypothetical protein